VSNISINILKPKKLHFLYLKKLKVHQTLLIVQNQTYLKYLEANFSKIYHKDSLFTLANLHFHDLFCEQFT